MLEEEKKNCNILRENIQTILKDKEQYEKDLFNQFRRIENIHKLEKEEIQKKCNMSLQNERKIYDTKEIENHQIIFSQRLEKEIEINNNLKIELNKIILSLKNEIKLLKKEIEKYSQVNEFFQRQNEPMNISNEEDGCDGIGHNSYEENENNEILNQCETRSKNSNRTEHNPKDSFTILILIYLD